MDWENVAKKSAIVQNLARYQGSDGSREVNCQVVGRLWPGLADPTQLLRVVSEIWQLVSDFQVLVAPTLEPKVSRNGNEGLLLR